MNFKKISIASFILLLSCSVFAFAHEPENLDTLKNNLIKYHDSGQYLKDQSAVINQAMAYLQNRVKTNNQNKKMAMVLDIDETSLSNYRDMLNLGFGGTFNEIVQDEGKGTDPAIAPTLKLYRYAKEHHVAVFFITGRTESYRDATSRNLSAVGYKNWDGLTLKPENYVNNSAAPYKIAARKVIADKGYDIVLNVGDQESDLIGGYADKTFKLPNPYYLIP